MLQQKEESKLDWKAAVEARLDSLESNQNYQAERLAELETTSLILKEDTVRIQDDLREIAKEVKRNWWRIQTPASVFIIVVLLMFIYILYNII